MALRTVWLAALAQGLGRAIAVASVAVALLVMLLWFITALLFRWRFQFSIRSLLVLTVAVAFCRSVGLAVEREQAERCKESGAGETRHWWAGRVLFYLISWCRLHGPTLPGGPPAPQWLQNLLGKEFPRNGFIPRTLPMPAWERLWRH